MNLLLFTPNYFDLHSLFILSYENFVYSLYGYISFQADPSPFDHLEIMGVGKTQSSSLYTDLQPPVSPSVPPPYFQMFPSVSHFRTPALYLH